MMQRFLQVILIVAFIGTYQLQAQDQLTVTIWDDTNGNGVDDGEPGIAGLEGSLTLYEDLNGNGIAEGGEDTGMAPTPDGSGSYTWDLLLAGVNNYIVGIADQAPTWYPTVHGPGPDGTDVDGDSDLDPLTLASHPFQIPTASNKTNVDFGLVAPASIGDLVWEDFNGNGQQDAGDNGFDWVAAGITIDIQLAGGGAVTDLTGAAPIAQNLGGGNYIFENLPPGDYELIFSEVVGAYFRTIGMNAGATVDSDPDQASGLTNTISLLSGDVDVDTDAGYIQPATISDLVWEDFNGNGQQDAGDNGFDWMAAGITIDIQLAGGGAVTDLTGGAPVAQNLGGGMYVFENLAPGDYELIFSQVPTLYYRTIGMNAGATVDSDPDQATGLTGVISLMSGDIDEDTDAGYLQPATISDFVWEDTNGNGIQDGGEPGLDGVDVNITDDLGGAVTDLDGNIVGTQTSGGGGMYMFELLPPGMYIVTFEDASGMNFYRTQQDAAGGATDAADADDDSDADMMTGESHIIEIESDETEEGIDAGYYEPATIEGLVFHDSNGNGQYDGADFALSGFTVQLADGGGATPVQDINGANVADLVSDGTGLVNFTDLPPGEYSLIFVPMAGWEFTYQDITGAIIPDVDDDSDVAEFSTGPSQSYTFTLLSGGSENNVGAGLFRRLTVGDFVWIETDNNGMLDGGENGATGVVVRLYYDTDFDGSAETSIDNITTDAAGFYMFDDLIPGNYLVQISNTNFMPGGALELFQNCSGGGSPTTDNDNDGIGDALALQDVESAVFELYCLPGGINQPGQDENLYVDFCFYFECQVVPDPDTYPWVNCETAEANPPICNIQVLDNFCGAMNTATSPGPSPSPLCPGGGSAHNMSWFAFVAGGAGFELQVVPSNCTDAGGFVGIQAGVYTDCTFSDAVFCQPDCSTGPITVGGGGTQLTPGETYYFFLDGCAGSVCDFEVNVIQGGQAFPLPSPTGLSCNVPDCGPVCPGSEITFTVEGIDLEIEYNWTIPADATLVGEGEQNGNLVVTPSNEIVLVFDNVGNYEVTMNFASNGCSTTNPPVSVDVVVENPEDEDFGEIIVCEHDFPYQITDLDPNGDGVSWQGGPINGPGTDITFNYTAPDGCMYDQIVDIIQIDNGDREEVEIALCEDELPFQYDGGNILVTNNQYENGFLYTLQNEQAANGCDSFINFTAVVLNIEGELFIEECTNNEVLVIFDQTALSPAAPEGFTFVWTNQNGDVLPPGNFDDQLIVTEDGEYTLTVTLSHFGKECTFVFGPIEVNLSDQLPPVSVAENWLLTPCGITNTVDYTVSNPDETVQFYEWSVTGGSIIDGILSETVTVQWTGGGGMICVAAVNQCGEGEEICMEVVIVDAPDVDIDLIVEECQDTTVTIGFIGSVSGNAVYDWDFGNGQTASTEGPHDIVYSTPGLYYVTLQVDDNGCISDEILDSILIIERLPAPVLSCISTPSSIAISWNSIEGATGYDVELIAGEMGMVVDDTSYVATGVGVGDSVLIQVSAISDSACEFGNPATFKCFAQDCDEPVFTFTPTRDTICLTTDVGLDTIFADVSIAGGTGVFTGTGITDGDVGEFDAAVAGVGMHNITYSWSDPDNCMFSRTILMHVFEQPIADFSTGLDTICINDVFTVSYTGGTTGSVLTWDFGADVDMMGSGEGPFDISYSTGGMKTITLTVDKAECSSGPFTRNVWVEDELPELVIMCETDATSVNYSWNDIADEYEVFIGGVSQGTQTNATYDNTGLAPGTTIDIEVIAISTNNCPDVSDTENCSANNCPGVSVDLFQSDSLICLIPATPSINLSYAVTGGFMDGSGVATWSGNGVDPVTGVFDPNAAGEGLHTITLEYVEGDCSAAPVEVVFTVFTQTTAEFDGVMTVCQGTEITLNHIGSAGAGAQYIWNTTGATVIGADDEASITLVYDLGGDYDISLQVNRNGCESEVVMQTITIDEMLQAPAIICADPTSTTITFEWGAVAGATMYEILIDGVPQGTQATTSYPIVGLNPGDTRTITVTALSDNSCPNSTSMRLCEAIDCPVTDVIPSFADTTICEGSGILLALDYTVDGGFMDGSGMGTYNGPATDANTGVVTTDDLIPGNYVVYIDYSEGPCDTRDSVLINVVDVPVPVLDLASDVCLTDILTVTYTGDNVPGSSFVIEAEGNPTIVNIGTDSYDYMWDTPGDYGITTTVTIGDCEATSEVYTVTVLEEIQLEIMNTVSDCINNLPETITLTATETGSDGSGVGVWSGDIVDANGVFDITQSGTGIFNVDYSFTENGCSFMTSATVEIFDAPTLMVTTLDSDCFDANNGSASFEVLGGDGDYTVTIDGANPEAPYEFNTATGTQDDLPPGTYSIVVVDGSLCSSETSFTITAPTEPSFDVTGPVSIPVGEFGDLGLDLGTISVENITNITWTDATGTVLCQGADCFDVTVSPSTNMQYCVDISLNGGCVVSDCITVISEFISVFNVSNVFSPNGDGTNENVVIQSNNPDLIANYMRIYDRWGNLVFNVEEPWTPYDDMTYPGWNGTFKGQRLNPGVFVYVIEIIEEPGKAPELIVGDITIVR